METNPRLQCEMCGRWYRLTQSGGMQWLYPFEGEQYGYPEIYYNSLCVACHLKFGIVLEPYSQH